MVSDIEDEFKIRGVQIIEKILYYKIKYVL
jgi:hypothetical protein